MNIIKLDTTKMSWTKTELGAANFKLLGLSISVSGVYYFNNIFVPILKNLVNVDFKLVIVKNSTSEKCTWTTDIIKFVGFDMIKQEFIESPTPSNISIDCLIRESQSGLGNNIRDYEIYILYK